MAEPTFKDHFSGHAPDYRAYRPDYPPALFDFLAEVAPPHDLAWDCGTGNGQAAVALAERFTRVVATDPSAEQVAQAEPHPRVGYAVAKAERGPLADRTADLITVAQAFHWFDFEPFFAEVRRVARPGGVLAVWSYGSPRVSPAVDRVLDKLEAEYVGPYWPPERRYVRERYWTVPFPFPELPVPAFEMTAEWDLAGVLGYLGTRSATQRFIEARGFDPVAELRDEFAAAWGDPATQRPVRWELFLRVGRVHP